MEQPLGPPKINLPFGMCGVSLLWLLFIATAKRLAGAAWEDEDGDVWKSLIRKNSSMIPLLRVGLSSHGRPRLLYCQSVNNLINLTPTAPSFLLS
jgi:hypothetical protein